MFWDRGERFDIGRAPNCLVFMMLKISTEVKYDYAIYKTRNSNKNKSINQEIFIT